MRVNQVLGRAADAYSATRALRRARQRETASREELADWQKRRLDVVVWWAAMHSPFYRGKTRLLSSVEALHHLPVLEPEALEKHFDEISADRSVSGEGIERWLAEGAPGGRLLGKYPVLTGTAAPFPGGALPLDGRGWAEVLAAYARAGGAGTGAVVRAPGSPVALDAVRSFYRAEDGGVLALPEAGVVARPCSAGALHLAEDMAVVELVDASDAPVKAGEAASSVLVTPFWSLVVPLIRFRRRLALREAEGACSCGSPFRRIEF